MLIIRNKEIQKYGLLLSYLLFDIISSQSKQIFGPSLDSQSFRGLLTDYTWLTESNVMVRSANITHKS